MNIIFSVREKIPWNVGKNHQVSLCYSLSLLSRFFILYYRLHKCHGFIHAKNSSWIIHGGTRKITVHSGTFYDVTVILATDTSLWFSTFDFSLLTFNFLLSTIVFWLLTVNFQLLYFWVLTFEFQLLSWLLFLNDTGVETTPDSWMIVGVRRILDLIRHQICWCYRCTPTKYVIFLLLTF